MAVDLRLALDLLTFAAVVCGILFGMVQIRQQNRKRRDAAGLEATHVFQTSEVRHAFQAVLALEDATPADVIFAEPRLRESADVIVFNLEAMGVLVFDGLLPLHVFDHLLGGFTRASLRKLRPYLDEQRRRSSPHFGEWFQWLAERLEQYPAPGKARPAYESFAGWKP